MRSVLLAAAAVLAASASCPQYPLGSGCSVVPGTGCGVIRCSVDYFGNSFTSTLRMHPCQADFNFVWGFNRSSTNLNAGYLVNHTEGFFVTDLSVNVPPIGASTIFALANITKVGTKAFSMQLGVRNCAVSSGVRRCYPSAATMLIDGVMDFSTLSCASSTPQPGVSPKPGVSPAPGVSPKPGVSSKPAVSQKPAHHDDHPPPAPKHHDDAPKPSKGGGGSKHPDSTSSHKNTPGTTTTTGGGTSSGGSGGGSSSSIVGGVHKIARRLNMKGLRG